MTTFARMIAFLLGLAVAACSFLPWVGSATAWNLRLVSLVSPGRGHDVVAAASLGLGLCVSATVLALGALLNSRTLVIVGGLVSVALPTIWILGNAVASDVGVPLSQVEIGAYGAAAAGLMTLVLAAVAADTRVPSAR